MPEIFKSCPWREKQDSVNAFWKKKQNEFYVLSQNKRFDIVVENEFHFNHAAEHVTKSQKKNVQA